LLPLFPLLSIFFPLPGMLCLPLLRIVNVMDR
jgi:hypothetical protein